MKKFNLTIDRQTVPAEQGMTVLEAATTAEIYIPTLCANSKLKPYGACRLCMVEIEGWRGLHAACTTAASQGMVVRTTSPVIDRVRRTIVELLLANGHDDCLTCGSNQRCELQKIAAMVGVRERRFQGERRSYPVDDSNPFFAHSADKCILCGICVRTCDEVQGLHALDFGGRGFHSKVAAGLDQPWVESICEMCGQCEAKCPVDALCERVETPGLPSGETRTVCTYCGVGCGLYLLTRGDRVIGVRGDPQNPPSYGRLCVKGRFGYSFINHPDRLDKPLIRRNGELKEATWDEALDYVAARLTELKEQHGGEALGFLSSAKCTNEENYLAQKFARSLLGTNNIDHCARL